jgi:hypothetical protein
MKLIENTKVRYASDSQKFFSNTFNIELDLVIFMQDVEKEVKLLSVFIKENNYVNLKKVISTKQFWLSNANKYPILFQLAVFILNILIKCMPRT